MFSPEYFCPNHQRFARKFSKISQTPGAAAPLPLPPRTVRLCTHFHGDLSMMTTHAAEFNFNDVSLWYIAIMLLVDFFGEFDGQ